MFFWQRRSDSVPYIEVSLSFEKGNPSDKTQVPLSRLDAMDWRTLDYRATFNPQVAPAKAQRHITSDVRTALADFSATDVYRLSHPGLCKINGEPVFCTGREVIRSPSCAAQGPEIECEQISKHLDFDPDLSEDGAAAEMLNLISLFPDSGRIVLTQVLVYLMRQAYEDAGRAPCFCVFVHGATGTQKTTIAKILTQIYNRGDGFEALTRLNTSRASAVELMMNLTDQVKVFDDLFPPGSTQVQKKQEETLAEITRYIGDGTIPARMKGNVVREGRPKCGVLFTGEYLIGTGSDAARLLPVEMAKPDTKALKYFLKQPLIVSTFYRNFISWLVENYGEIVAYFKDWLDVYRETDLGVHDRLRETHYFLNSAYSVFLEYCRGLGILTEEEVQQFQNSFAVLLTQLVRQQNERVSPTASTAPIQGNVLERIRELYRSKQISIPDNKNQFDDEQHDGIRHQKCLCLRPKFFSKFFPSSDINEVAHELEVNGALISGTDGLTKKISAAHGNYFYWIPLDRL